MYSILDVSNTEKSKSKDGNDFRVSRISRYTISEKDS